MFKLIHNHNCSKSRDCKKILEQKKIKFELIEYSKNKLSMSQISEIISKIFEVDSILRPNEKNFKLNKRDLSNKKELIKFLHDNQNCIQRPIFFDGMKYHVCRPPKKVNELL